MMHGLQRVVATASLGKFLLVQKVEVLSVINGDDCLLVTIRAILIRAPTITLDLTRVRNSVNLDDAHAVDLGEVVFDFDFSLPHIRSHVDDSLRRQVITLRHHLKRDLREPDLGHDGHRSLVKDGMMGDSFEIEKLDNSNRPLGTKLENLESLSSHSSLDSSSIKSSKT